MSTRRWLLEELHPAMALPAYIAMVVAMLVFYWMLSIIVPVTVSFDRVAATAAIFAAVLLGWHLRRLYEEGELE